MNNIYCSCGRKVNFNIFHIGYWLKRKCPCMNLAAKGDGGEMSLNAVDLLKGRKDKLTDTGILRGTSPRKSEKGK